MTTNQEMIDAVTALSLTPWFCIPLDDYQEAVLAGQVKIGDLYRKQ